MKGLTVEFKERFLFIYAPIATCLFWGCILGAVMIAGASPRALGTVGLAAVTTMTAVFIVAALKERDLRLASKAGELRTGQENRELRDSLREAGMVLDISRYAAFPEKLSSALEHKFPEMSGHWEWVACYGELICGRLGLSAEQTAAVVRASLLMDLGMLEMDDAIRLRKGQPQGEEKAMIKNHPLYGERMLSRIESDWVILPMVRSHHEWWNGWGYPDGLQGEEIPLGARILGLADAFVAMLSPRAYREPRTLESVLDEIFLYRGKQFDPQVVDAFLELTIERFDLPPSEWARLRESVDDTLVAANAGARAEVVANADAVVNAAAAAMSTHSGPSMETHGEWSIDEDRVLLEALWDINGVKRLSRVA